MLRLFHTAPNISHYANNRDSGKLKAGMVATIEPMLCAGRQEGIHWPDNVRARYSIRPSLSLTSRLQWTCTTADGRRSAQFEETILITEDGCEVLTAAPGWTLPPPDSEPSATA